MNERYYIFKLIFIYKYFQIILIILYIYIYIYIILFIFIYTKIIINELCYINIYIYPINVHYQYPFQIHAINHAFVFRQVAILRLPQNFQLRLGVFLQFAPRRSQCRGNRGDLGHWG